MGGDEQGKSIHCFVRFYRNKSIAYKSIKNITKMIRFFWEKRLILTKTKQEPSHKMRWHGFSSLRFISRGRQAENLASRAFMRRWRQATMRVERRIILYLCAGFPAHTV